MTNNIKFIDLGLPSGTLWADRNVGANAPNEYGEYFRFGETTPFTEKSPEYVYNDINESIAGTDKDAATTILGAQFRMPTLEQIIELNDVCTWKWTFKIGFKGIKKGVKVIGPNGKSIFFPASGYCFYSGYHSDDLFLDVGSACNYWSASPSSIYYGYYLTISSSCRYLHWNSYNRAYGFPVRAVKG